MIMTEHETPDETCGSWSIRRAIEVLDEAIDRMGAQLVRASETPMDWSPEQPGERPAPLAVPGRRARVSALSSVFDAGWCEPPDIQGPELP
jgi:hypothetical protein